MKVLLVSGSPNRSGCTHTALSVIAGVLAEEGIETEEFWIGTNVPGCTACGGCRSSGSCVIDDAVNLFREKARSADGFVFGSPVHYASPGGNMISFMDRLFFSDSGESFRLKPACAIVSARRAGTTAAFDVLNKYFTISEMPVISSRYWSMVHGSCPEDVLQDKEGLYTLRVLGRNMAYFLRCISAGKELGVALPSAEKPQRTNFIR